MYIYILPSSVYLVVHITLPTFDQLYLILLKNCTNFQLIPDMSTLSFQSHVAQKPIHSFLPSISFLFQSVLMLFMLLKISITLLASHLIFSCIHICNHLLWLFSYILLLLKVKVPSIFSYACLDAALLFPLPFVLIAQGSSSILYFYSYL